MLLFYCDPCREGLRDYVGTLAALCNITALVVKVLWVIFTKSE